MYSQREHRNQNLPLSYVYNLSQLEEGCVSLENSVSRGESDDEEIK